MIAVKMTGNIEQKSSPHKRAADDGGEDRKRMDVKKESMDHGKGERGRDHRGAPHHGGHKGSSGRRGGHGAGAGGHGGGGGGGMNRGGGGMPSQSIEERDMHDNMGNNDQVVMRGRGGRDRERGDRGQYTADQPQVSLEEALPPSDKKFTGRCRLFVGNLPTDTTEDEFKSLFKDHGEFTEVFLNPSRGFGFIRMDLKKNAESAKAAIDGVQRKGRTLRVRFATHGAALKVKHLPIHVSNELLAQAFSIFGELERAVIIVDDRGKPICEGIVEFARKPGAQAALKRISEGVFMMGSSPRPITVEPMEQKDEEDGYPEKFIQKTVDINREREQGPRFAPPGSFEFDFGQKWKDLYMLHEERLRAVRQQLEDGINKLEMEQAGALMEHQTNMLRQDLLRRQEELRRLEEMQHLELQKRMDIRSATVCQERREIGSRRQDEERRRVDEERRRQEMEMRRQQQEERRQQELYAQQERAMRELHGERGSGGHGNAPPMQPPPAPPSGMGIEGRAGVGRNGGKNMQANQGNNIDNQGGYGGGNQMGQNPPMRQSRFDQPPGFNQGHGGEGTNVGGGMGNNHGGGGGNMMGMGMGRGNMGNERMMERGNMGNRGNERSMHEEQQYFESKRARRY